jgi:hypothetical protein
MESDEEQEDDQEQELPPSKKPKVKASVEEMVNLLVAEEWEYVEGITLPDGIPPATVDKYIPELSDSITHYLKSFH